MKTGRWIVGERGQTLIIVAVALTVLLMFVALAIDVGNMYQVRRQMQNAADAGALAGARELCFGSGDRGQAEARAREYAQLNGAEDVEVNFINGGWTVNVVARIPADMYVADIMGISTVDVGAEAAAACGSAVSACGLWPVAFSQSTWNYLLDNGYGCGERFFVWTGDNLNDSPRCWDPNTIYDCDVNDDGKIDFVDIVSRGWLDFSDVTDVNLYPDACSKPGCGESELACWIEDDSPAKITVPSCIPGLKGVKAGVKDEVNSRINDFVSIVIFDSTGCSGTSSCPGGDTYHASKFGCIRVEGWIQNFELPQKPDPVTGKRPQPPWKGSVIAASINCSGCTTDCGETGGAPPEKGGVRAVSLIK